MFEQQTAVFLINLVQDVNVLRPLMIMAHRDFGFRVLILVSSKLPVRDHLGIWEAELEILRKETNARLLVYGSDLDVFRELTGTGLIFSASESNLPEHSAPHGVFRFAPPTFLTVTLQHGFECVGFRQNAAHDRAYGKSVSFAADLICSWQPPEMQPALASSQRRKVRVTGPTAALQSFGEMPAPAPSGTGLVCENLHSVRLGSKEGLKRKFVSTFTDFCGSMAADGKKVTLRPHPGGQYVLKKNVELPPNVALNNAPMYRVDLRRFSYGISAPSSVLIDMLIAGIPTAVWQDAEGEIDSRNYAGLTRVADARQWYDFAMEAAARPEPFIKLQQRFLEEQSIPHAGAEVFARYAEIFRAAQRIELRSSPAAQHRFLIVANAHLPTVQVCLEQPLQASVLAGDLVLDLLTETRIKAESARRGSADDLSTWLQAGLDQFSPDAIIFSRYSGPCADEIVDWADRNGVAVIYQIDDDLLGVPRSLGEAKYAYHNAPERLETVGSLLRAADVVYVSTDVLRDRLIERVPAISAIAGAINASGRVMKRPTDRAAKTIGYMASADHLPNLEMVLPAIIDVLERHPHLAFELFGSIPIPEALGRLGDRIRKIDPVADYASFLDALKQRDWDIGVCPLVPTEFNRTKSNNKWIEYTSLGIASVASGGMIYDECCADGCGILATDLDEWRHALEMLVSNPVERLAMVNRAQRKLEENYGIAKHRDQILRIVEIARERARTKSIEEIA